MTSCDIKNYSILIKYGTNSTANKETFLAPYPDALTASQWIEQKGSVRCANNTVYNLKTCEWFQVAVLRD